MLSNMLTPDAIHDTALLTISAWQRETSQQAANRLLYRDQARRWAQQDNQSDQDWHRVKGPRASRHLQDRSEVMTDWKSAPEILLDQIAAIRDEYQKRRRDCLDQMEWHASQGDSEETGDFSTEAERHGAALLACNRILKLVSGFKATEPRP